MQPALCGGLLEEKGCVLPWDLKEAHSDQKVGTQEVILGGSEARSEQRKEKEGHDKGHNTITMTHLRGQPVSFWAGVNCGTSASTSPTLQGQLGDLLT